METDIEGDQETAVWQVVRRSFDDDADAVNVMGAIPEADDPMIRASTPLTVALSSSKPPWQVDLEALRVLVSLLAARIQVALWLAKRSWMKLVFISP